MWSVIYYISAISSMRSVLLVEETGGPGENHRPVASHWQPLSHNVIHLSLIEIRTHNISGARHWVKFKVNVMKWGRGGCFFLICFFISNILEDITNTARSASYLDLHLQTDSQCRVRTKHYDKREDFTFPIVKFPYICNNIPAAPVYGVYISQLIQYSRACGSYHNILDKGLLLTRKLLNQGYLLDWNYHFESFTVTTMTWLTVTQYLCHKLPRICFICRKHFEVLSSFMTYHWVCNEYNTTAATNLAVHEIVHPSGTPEFTPLFYWVSSCSSFSFLCSILSFFFWPLSIHSSSSGHCVVCSSSGHCVVWSSFSGHCVVCSSSIYGLWLPLWHLQTFF